MIEQLIELLATPQKDLKPDLKKRLLDSGNFTTPEDLKFVDVFVENMNRPIKWRIIFVKYLWKNWHKWI